MRAWSLRLAGVAVRTDSELQDGLCDPGFGRLAGDAERDVQPLAQQVDAAVGEEKLVAHCWVQHQGLVVSDRLERVSGYTPILVV